MTIKNMSFKTISKRSLQYIAAALGRHKRASNEPQLLILMYHRILPEHDPRAEQEEPGMMVTPETFKMHMSIIKQYFKVLPLSQWIQRKNNGDTLPSRCCAITFDDGWADNYEFAFPILKKLNLSATIYLVADMIDTYHRFWPERLAHIITHVAKQPALWSHKSLNWITQFPTCYEFSETNSTPPNREQLSEIIAAAKTLSDNEVHRRIDLIEQQLKADNGSCYAKPGSESQADLLNWQQVEEMCQSKIIEIGSHTCNHTRLTGDKSSDVLEHEVAYSKQTIEEKSGFDVKTFCYPNGDFSTAAETLVKQYYDGAVTTKTGWNTSANNPYLLQRIGLHEDISNDKISFLARISGWL